MEKQDSHNVMGKKGKISGQFGQLSLKFIHLFCFLALGMAVQAANSPSSGEMIITLKAGATAADIQKDFDLYTNGCEILLPPGKFKINQPIVLQHEDRKSTR